MKSLRIIAIFSVITIFYSNTYCATKPPANLKGNLTTLKQSLVSLKTKLGTLSKKLNSLKIKLIPAPTPQASSFQIVFIKPAEDLKTIGTDFAKLVDAIKNNIIIKNINAPQNEFNLIQANPNLNILIIAGSHGDYDAIFDKKFNVEYLKTNIVTPIKSNDVKFDIIIVEACITGYVMSAFKELLKDNGIILGTLTSTPDLLTTVNIFTSIKDKKSIDKSLILQTIEDKIKGQLIGSIKDQKDFHAESDFKEYFQTYTVSKGLNLTVQEITAILTSGATDDFTQPFDQLAANPTGAEVQQAIKECIEKIKNFIAKNKAVVQTFPPEVKEWNWDAVQGNFLAIVPDAKAHYDWSNLRDELLGNLSSALAIISQSLKNKPLIDFLDQNPPATLLLYSNTDKKYYHEQWVTTDFAAKIGTYSEGGTFDTVKIEFDNIKKRYPKPEQSKFTAVLNLPAKLKELWKLPK
ncbi:MAG: hypothetical protein V1646_04850 [bacterium]